VSEAPADDDAPVGDVQRGEPATPQLLPVVVVDARRTELGAGDPDVLSIPDDRGRLAVNADLPAHSSDRAAIDRDEGDAAVPPDGDAVVPACGHGSERRDHAPRLQLDVRVQPRAVGSRGDGLRHQHASRVLLPRSRPDEAIADDGDSLHVVRELASPYRVEAADRTRSADLGPSERPKQAEVIQHHDDTGRRDVEDRVDIEVVLRGLVVIGKLGLVEDRARLEPSRREHDVPTEVVPCAHVAEVGDSPDPFGLRVPHPALGVRVELGHSSSPSASTTSAGRIFSRQRAPTGQLRGCHPDPGELTRALYA
jgi:hypothetical protein